MTKSQKFGSAACLTAWMMGATWLGIAQAADAVAATASVAVRNADDSPLGPERIKQWCAEVQKATLAMKWKIQPCEDGVVWKADRESFQGRPLVYAEFGDPKSANTTLVMTMVHGDEITPLYLGLKLSQWMKENQGSLPSTHVVIAPLVNPDGFFAEPRTRVNARGVDVNRNFATRDWPTHALRAWKKETRSNPRRFPGSAPGTEPETQFQVALIQKFKPQKILSVHAPLNHLDYDGPTPLALNRFSQDYIQECLRLRNQLKARTTGWFPGSLGNYTGQEMGIPTLTLELPTADQNLGLRYWNQFRPGIRTMIEFKVPELSTRGLAKSPEIHDT